MYRSLMKLQFETEVQASEALERIETLSNGCVGEYGIIGSALFLAFDRPLPHIRICGIVLDHYDNEYVALTEWDINNVLVVKDSNNA